MKTYLSALFISTIASILLNIVCGEIIIGFNYDVTSYILGGINGLIYFAIVDILKEKTK